jgi:hypothetical protein
MVPALAFDCVSFFNHFKKGSAFHGFASLLFLDLSRDFHQRRSLISSRLSLTRAPDERQTDGWRSISTTLFATVVPLKTLVGCHQ